MLRRNFVPTCCALSSLRAALRATGVPEYFIRRQASSLGSNIGSSVAIADEKKSAHPRQRKEASERKKWSTTTKEKRERRQAERELEEVIPKVLRGNKQSEKSMDSEELSDLYEALTEPVALPDPIGPTAVTVSKLDPHYLENLRLQLESITNDKQSLINERVKLVETSLTNAPRVELLTQLIQVNALTHRPQQALEAFRMIEAKGLTPDSVAYNNLLDAFARVNDLPKVLELFQEMQKANVPADVVTYGVVLKALVKQKDVGAAFKIYRDMKAKHIRPTQPIFTMLIQACLRSGDVKRAWKTFDHMRLETHQPDTVTYSLMIYACAQTEDAERALDLFQEMSEKGLAVNEVTFTALVRACASRMDYYNEAWELLEQMVAKGFNPTMRTYNALLQCTAKHGDIVRARTVWNDLISRAEADEKAREGWVVAPGTELRPDRGTYLFMLQTYAEALRVIMKGGASMPGEGISGKKGAKKKVDDGGMEARDDVTASAPTPEGVNQLPPAPPDLTVETPHGLELQPTDISGAALMRQAEELWSYIVNESAAGGANTDATNNLAPRVPINTLLLDTYLTIFANSGNLTNAQKAITFFETAYKAYGLEPTGKAYSIVLSLYTKNRELMTSGGKEFWEKLLAWDEEKEKAMTSETLKLTELEKEEIRTRQGRGKKVMHRNFCRMILGYTRLNDLNSALEVLQYSRVFRYHFYLEGVHFTHIWPLVLKCRDQAEDGNIEYARRLADLCRPPARNALEEVQRTLKSKWVGNKKWWGWAVVSPEVRFLPDKKERTKIKKQKERAKLARQEATPITGGRGRWRSRRRFKGAKGSGRGGQKKTERKPYVRRGE